MAEGRHEWVLSIVDLWNAGEYDRFLDELGPDLVFTPDPSFPDAGTYSGDEFRAWLHEWISTWEQNRYELLGLTELERAVVAQSRWHLASRGSADEVPIADFSVVWLFADEAAERPNRMAAFFDRDRAMEVARAGTG
jgi:SnoaL-like protein